MSQTRLILGDCLEELPALFGTFDAVVTDPPYGIGYQRKNGGGHGVHAMLRDHGLRPRRNVAMPVAGDDRPFDPTPWVAFPCLLWGANHFASRLPAGGSWLAWDKHRGQGPDDDFVDCEFGWCSIAKIKRNVCRYLWKGVACVKAGEANGHRWHPMQKPVGLMCWSLERLKLPPGATVLDPYMGSATTGVACVQMGLNFVGVEIDPGYFAVAERRLAEAKAGAPLFSVGDL